MPLTLRFSRYLYLLIFSDATCHSLFQSALSPSAPMLPFHSHLLHIPHYHWALMIFHMTSMLYSLFIYAFKFCLIKRSVNFLMPISRSTCFSFIFVAVIKYSAESNMREENVYLAFNFRPNNKSRHGRNLKIGLFAISHSIASDQGTHSAVKKVWQESWRMYSC